MELDDIKLALDRLCQNLGGSWLLLGGSLIRLDVDSQRGTKGNGRVYRPNLTLFSYLKLQRGTDVDVEDIQKAAQKWGVDEFNLDKFKVWADKPLLDKAKRLKLY